MAIFDFTGSNARAALHFGSKNKPATDKLGRDAGRINDCSVADEAGMDESVINVRMNNCTVDDERVSALGMPNGCSLVKLGVFIH